MDATSRSVRPGRIGWLRRLGFTVLALVVAVPILIAGRDGFERVANSLAPPIVYWKDCGQPFLMAEAVTHGVSPYESLTELAKRWLPLSRPFDHPTPYPPFVAVLSLSLAHFPFEAVAAGWLGMEILCLVGIVLLVLHWWGAAWNPVEIMLVVALLVLIGPVNDGLYLGQFMTLLGLLMVAAWIALRVGDDFVGGALLGMMMAIKVVAWPIGLYLVLRRRWRAVAAAGGVLVLAHLAAAAVMGVAPVFHYYAKVGGLNAAMWRPAEGNLSVWAWGIRIFSGAGFGFSMRPLWASPELASVATWLAPLAALGLALTLAARARHFDTAFGILAVASIVLSPIAWNFYAVLAVIPVVVLARRLEETRAPAEMWVLFALFVAGLILRGDVVGMLARAFGDGKTVSFAASLFTELPVLAMLGVLWMLWRTDGRVGGDSWSR